MHKKEEEMIETLSLRNYKLKTIPKFEEKYGSLLILDLSHNFISTLDILKAGSDTSV